MHIEWENIQVKNYAEVMKARLAAAVDLPDVINMSLLGDIGQHGRDGLIIPLNDLLETHAPNINKWWNTGTNSIYKILDTSPDGNIYGVGNYVLPHYLSFGPLWNVLWLEAVGIADMPETQADMMTALRAFRDDDPNGNGQQDEIPLTPAAGRGYLRYLGNLYGFEYSIMTEYLVDDDGQVFWIFQSPRMKEYLTWLNQLYTEGLLDKAYATDSWTETLEKVSNDQVGLISCWTTFARIYSGAHPSGKPDASIPVFVNGPPIEGPYGDKFFVKRERYGGDQMGITKDSKQPEVAMHWIDFIRNSDEALMLQNFGIIGDTYRMVDGEIETIGSEDKPFDERLREIGGSQPPYAHLQWAYAWDFRNPQWVLDNNNAYQKYYKVAVLPAGAADPGRAGGAEPSAGRPEHLQDGVVRQVRHRPGAAEQVRRVRRRTEQARRPGGHRRAPAAVRALRRAGRQLGAGLSDEDRCSDEQAGVKPACSMLGL